MRTASHRAVVGRKAAAARAVRSPQDGLCKRPLSRSGSSCANREEEAAGTEPAPVKPTGRRAAAPTPLTPHVAWPLRSAGPPLLPFNTSVPSDVKHTDTTGPPSRRWDPVYTATRGIQHERQGRNQTQASDAMSLGLRFTLFVFVDKSKALPHCPLRGELLFV